MCIINACWQRAWKPSPLDLTLRWEVITIIIIIIIQESKNESGSGSGGCKGTTFPCDVSVRIRGRRSEVTTSYHIRSDFRLKRRSYHNGFLVLLLLLRNFYMMSNDTFRKNTSWMWPNWDDFFLKT